MQKESKSKSKKRVPTPIGKIILDRLDQRNIMQKTVSTAIGWYRQRFENLLYNPTMILPLPVVFRIAKTISLSPIQLLLPLYGRTNDEENMTVKSILILDRFLRLPEPQQEVAMKLLDSLVEAGEVELTPEQKDVRDRLVMLPDHYPSKKKPSPPSGSESEVEEEA
jgi:hypothetical protein